MTTMSKPALIASLWLIVTCTSMLAGAGAEPAKTDPNRPKAREPSDSPSVMTKGVGPPGRNTDVIYYDDSFLFMARNYGDHRDFHGNTEPGLFIHSKKHDKWLQIQKIASKGGTFGKSESANKDDQKKLAMISVGWDYTSLAGQAYADMPLRSSGSIVFPDKIEWQEDTQRYKCGFNTKIEIRSAASCLFINRADLERAFERHKEH